MFDRMTDDSPFLIKLKDKQSREFLAVVLPLPTPKPLRNLIHVLARSNTLVKCPCAFSPRFAYRPPSDYELFPRGRERGEWVCGSGFNHALGEDLELHVSDDGDAAPCDGGGPQGSGVGDPAGDGREMGVSGGEEVKGYVRGEDLLRERRLEEGRESFLEDSESFSKLHCS